MLGSHLLKHGHQVAVEEGRLVQLSRRDEEVEQNGRYELRLDERWGGSEGCQAGGLGFNEELSRQGGISRLNSA